MKDIAGAITALVTPFDAEGAIDYAAFERLVDWQINEGISAVVACGTTSESATLSHAEKEELITCAVRVSAGRIPVIAGTGGNNTETAIRDTRRATELGADAALVVAPYYNKPDRRGLAAHFDAVHDATDLPLIIYNIPGRAVVDIAPDLMAELAALERIIGVKDATGDLSRVVEQRRLCGKDFQQFSGEDATMLGFNAMGGRGVISVVSNIVPAMVSRLQAASLDGDYVTALALQDKLASLMKACFATVNPVPAKYALSRLGFGANHVRLPLAVADSSVRAQMDQAMHGLGLL